MVIITLLPWHDTFLKLLSVLAELRRTDIKDFHQFLTEAYNSGVPDVGSQLLLVYSQGQSQFIFERPKQFQLPSIPENHNLNLYYNFVYPKNMIAVFAAMLAERRIIFTSKRLDRLSSCIQAANAFLYPMVWQHIFIPMMPMKLKDYLSAPMPYLIGVPTMVLDTMMPEELGDVVILNCDRNTFESPFDDVHSMPPEIVAHLKKELNRTSEHMGDRVSKIFLGVLVQLIGGYRDAVEFRDTGKTFNSDKFIDSRPSHLRPFLRKMMELQIFRQFIDERLEMMNTGLGFSDEFEQETVRYAEKRKKHGRFYQFKEKVKGSSQTALHAYKNLKSKLRDITPPHTTAHNTTHFRSQLTSNSQHDRIDGVVYGKDSPIKSYMGRHSAPSSPIFGKRVNGVAGTSSVGFQYASKEQITSASLHLRRAPTPLAMSSSSTHIQSNGYAKSSTGSYNLNNNVASSPTVSPASSLCSSEMNLSQELQNHPLFKTPIVDRSLKPCHSLEPNHRITASRTGGPPPARPPPPAPHLLQLYQQQPQQQLYGPTYYNHPYGSHPRVEGKPPFVPSRPAQIYIPKSKSQTLNTASITTTTTTATSNHLTHQQQLQLQAQSQPSYTSSSNPNNQLTPTTNTTTDSSYDTPPDMQSPPVPPRRQGNNTPPTPTPFNGGGVNMLSNAVAATAAAVTAGITRLERNCWQDYAETQLLQNDSLRSSASSSSNTSNLSNSSSSSASFVTAASRFSLYQSSPPGCEPPVPAPRLKKDKDKESLRSLQPQHMTMGMNGINNTASLNTTTTNTTTIATTTTNTTAANNSHASEDSMKDLISLDDSHNSSFDLEDFDPLNQNARPLPTHKVGGGINSTSNTHMKSTTLPTTNAKNPSTLMTISSISNPLYTYYTPQHLPQPMALKPPTEKPPPLPKTVPPPMPPPDEDFELLRKYGLDQFTLITTTVTTTSNSSTITTSGMSNWTTFD
ncbi:mucin-5AC isoform X3 [Lucilia cuprina]|uniref:mucin-5AC isoform X3 n=1 Tax=Lucilia cuprina TaxID=7375 RepID=UPI001F059B4A|nr:mucin-5AC isoform X3 [Lucilia cuprina]